MNITKVNTKAKTLNAEFSINDGPVSMSYTVISQR